MLLLLDREHDRVKKRADFTISPAAKAAAGACLISDIRLKELPALGAAEICAADLMQKMAAQGKRKVWEAHKIRGCHVEISIR